MPLLQISTATTTTTTVTITTIITTMTTTTTHIKKVEQGMDVGTREEEDAQSHSIHPCLSLQLHAGHHLGMHLRREQWVWQTAEVLLQEAGAVNDVHSGWEAVPRVQKFLDITQNTNKRW